MGDLLEYLAKVFVAVCVIWFVLKIVAALVPDTPSHYSSYSSGSSYSSSSGSKSSSGSYRGSSSSSSSYSKKATPTPSSSRKNSSSRGRYDEADHPDPDDYMDVEGFYYDNRGDFENEDDAWDYLDDEYDEWED
ncbi:MAG: hypothetical protein K6E50_14855 [Lachnospiraceae bacterium]|nr:hypothetical protein [Lachnospiraceae bacterium]